MMNRFPLHRARLLLVATMAMALDHVAAETWPTYRHDNRRSGVTSDSLSFPIQQLWVRRSSRPPQAAWTGPAKWDAWAANSGLQSMRNFDPCFFVTSDGPRVYFGSSVDDAVHCLDASSGHEKWVYFTGAAVRFPPTIHDARAYFGSDDGFVYCCRADSGELVWKLRAAPTERRITSDRKLISLWPVRTGILIQDNRAMFASSLVPWEPSLLWSVEVTSGRHGGEGTFRKEIQGVTLQGALLASDRRVYVPQGRAAPLAFDLASGKPNGAIGEAGGVFCILTEDEMLLSGPQNQKSPDDEIRIADGQSRRRLASFSGTSRILVAGNYAWVPADGKLKMLDRAAYVDAQQAIDLATRKLKEKQKRKEPTEPVVKELTAAKQKREAAWRWQVECPQPIEMIKTRNAIVIGFPDQVRAVSAVDGRTLWQASVKGTADGLAVAKGRLFVSTGLGHIYAFGTPP